MMALFVFSGRFSACSRRVASGTVFGLVRSPEPGQNFLYDTGLHYPVRIPKLSPFLFLSLCPKFQSPILGAIECSCIKGSYRMEKPMAMFYYSHAALPIYYCPSPAAMGCGQCKACGHTELGNGCPSTGLGSLRHNVVGKRRELGVGEE